MGDTKKNKEPDLDTSDRELEGDPIVAELRKLYEGVVNEPLPDELVELLRKLDEVERNR